MTPARTFRPRWLYWSLAALVAMLAPALTHTRPWPLLFIGVLIAWRLAHQRFKLPLPRRPLRMVLTILAVAGIWLSYGTVFGVMAGSVLLIVMAGLKLIESRRQRDFVLLLIITLFIALADFLNAPSALLAAYMLPALWLTFTAFIIVNDRHASLSAARASRISAGLLIPALPIAVVLFFIFPRIHVPLWQFNQHSVATTGISNTLSPGSISQLTRSNAIAFRVHFDTDHAVQTVPNLYWRGPVLHRFSHGTWSQGRRHTPPGRVQMRGPAVQYTITLQPNNHRWLFALNLPSSWPDNAILSGDYTLYTRKPIRKRRHYRVTSHPQARYGLTLTRAQRERDLQLPRTGNPRARQLAQHWRGAHHTSSAIIKQALHLFATGDFYYTLKPQSSPRNGIDFFLFNNRRGFCEHYASAFVFLMRAAGIPAHIVVGYAGGERNPIDGNITVRQSRAHAWAEVWLKGQGWVRIDPTAAIPSNHVDTSAATTTTAGLRRPASNSGWLQNLGYAWTATRSFWHRWVMAYGPTLQKAAFARLGIDYGNWLNVLLTMMGALTALIATAFGWQWLSGRRTKTTRNPAQRYYRLFCKRLARCAVARKPHEGPQDFAYRAAAALPQHAAAIHRITRLYIALRYEGDARQAPALARAVRRFKPH